jgi:hypothetical protein
MFNVHLMACLMLLYTRLNGSRSRTPLKRIRTAVRDSTRFSLPGPYIGSLYQAIP